jgi:hypothetical protein
MSSDTHTVLYTQHTSTYALLCYLREFTCSSPRVHGIPKGRLQYAEIELYSEEYCEYSVPYPLSTRLGPRYIQYVIP